MIGIRHDDGCYRTYFFRKLRKNTSFILFHKQKRATLNYSNFIYALLRKQFQKIHNINLVLPFSFGLAQQRATSPREPTPII